MRACSCKIFGVFYRSRRKYSKSWLRHLNLTKTADFPRLSITYHNQFHVSSTFVPVQPFSKTINNNRIILKSLENMNLRASYIQLLLSFDNSTDSSLDIQRNILKVFSSLRNIQISSTTCRNMLFQIYHFAFIFLPQK